MKPFMILLFLVTSSCTGFNKSPPPASAPPLPAPSATPVEVSVPSELPYQVLRIQAANPENTAFSPLALKPSPMVMTSLWAKDPQVAKKSGLQARPLSLKDLNAWFSSVSEGAISNILDTLDPKIQILAASFIQFKGDWVHPFSKDATIPGHFQSSAHSMSVASMMHQADTFLYGEDSLSRWVELPYRDSPFVMDLVLPLKRFELSKVIEGLSGKSVSSAIGALKPEKVDLVVPRFQYAGKAEIKDALTLLGMVAKSKPEKMTGISISLDEKGTSPGIPTGSKPAPIRGLLNKKFYCDEPFLWILRDSKTGEIQMIGQVRQPKS
jgi:serpin B